MEIALRGGWRRAGGTSATRGAGQRLRFLVFLLALVGVGGLLPIQLGITMGESMAPTLSPGTPFVIDRAYYRSHPFTPGDVVVFRLDGKTYVKRVSGVGGQRLWVWVLPDEADEALRQVVIPPDMVERYNRLGRRDPGLGRLRQIGLPADTVYVVGDNSTVSIDSRSFGPIPSEAILGRVRPLLPWRRLPGPPESGRGASLPASSGGQS